MKRRTVERTIQKTCEGNQNRKDKRKRRGKLKKAFQGMQRKRKLEKNEG